MDPHSLSEEQRAKIRARVAAETYRSSLQKRRLSEITAWEFANSAFGLWLFSAVVVTGLTTGVTKYLEHSRQRELKQQCFSQLQGELLARKDKLYIVAGIHQNADFLAAAMSGGRKQKYLALAIGPRLIGIPFDLQPFAGLPSSELLRIVENSVKDTKTRDAARLLMQQAIYLDLQLVNQSGESEDTTQAAYLLAEFWTKYSAFVYDGFDSFDISKVSISCLPKSYNTSKRQ